MTAEQLVRQKVVLSLLAEHHSLTKVGRLLGISRQRVFQIRERAIVMELDLIGRRKEKN